MTPFETIMAIVVCAQVAANLFFFKYIKFLLAVFIGVAKKLEKD